jgi:hypothetical protein
MALLCLGSVPAGHNTKLRHARKKQSLLPEQLRPDGSFTRHANAYGCCPGEAIAPPTAAACAHGRFARAREAAAH